jgi:hypothetical protein
MLLWYFYQATLETPDMGPTSPEVIGFMSIPSTRKEIQKKGVVFPG